MGASERDNITCKWVTSQCALKIGQADKIAGKISHYGYAFGRIIITVVNTAALLAVDTSLLLLQFFSYCSIYGSRQISWHNSGRTCARCLANIASSELVMKAKCFLYHVECFKCVMCDVPLIKGDLFGMFEAVVYCQTHYQQQRDQLFSEDFVSQNFYGFEAGGVGGHLPASASPLLPGLGPSGLGMSGPTVPWPPAGTSPDSSSEYHTDTSISPTTKKKRGRRKRELSCEDEANSSRGCFPYIDPNTGLVEKTKRARTSFKHHQLRIMKSHFQMNQNPDSRELKELATKTGLDKKVLQVCMEENDSLFLTIMMVTYF